MPIDANTVSHRTLRLLPAILLAVAVLCAFWPLSQCDFLILDDSIYVTDNPQVQKGITASSIAWAFTTTKTEFYHPLTWLSLMLDYDLYGLNPGGFHLTNLFLHMVNTLLLYLLLLQMTGERWKSAFAAALFGLHPLHVESVAWVAARKDLVSTLFWMLTLWAYTAYSQKPAMGRYLAVTLCLVLGLLAKPMLVTLPFVLLLLDWWPLRRFDTEGGESERPQFAPSELRFLVWGKIPWIAIALIAAAGAYYAQKVEGGIVSTATIGLQPRLENAVLSYVRYLGKVVWPTDLSVFYPFPKAFPLWQTMGCLVVIIGVTLLAIERRHRLPYLPVGWLWYLGSLVPVIGIVKIGAFSIADRYTYVPLIGIFVIAAWGGADLLGHLRAQGNVTAAAAIALLVGLSVVTWQQCRVWQNSWTLYNHALESTPENDVVHFGLGQLELNRGGYEKALYHYGAAVRANPENAVARYVYGRGLMHWHRYEEAIHQFNEAIRLYPGYRKAKVELAKATEMIAKRKKRPETNE